MRHRIFEIPEDQARYLVPAIDKGQFPWEEKVAPGVLRDLGNRDYIPAKLSDLSRWHGSGTEHGTHVHGPDVPHVLEARNRVLGLFWLNYQIEVDQSLIHEPDLLAEVFWAEGAHAIDYAVLTDPQREEITAALHPHGPDEHTWWEVHDYSGEYNRLLGETFMEVIVEAYTPLKATINLSHPVTDYAIEVTKQILTPELTTAPTGQTYFGSTKGKVFHDDHAGISQDIMWNSYQEAVDAGRRPCKTCKPEVAG